MFLGLYEDKFLDKWWLKVYGYEVKVVKLVVDVEGVKSEFERVSRLNGMDEVIWDFGVEEDRWLE